MEHVTGEWTLEQVVDYIKRAADSFIGNRKCKFKIEIDEDFVKQAKVIHLVMATDSRKESRKCDWHENEGNTMELLDALMVKLTHMAVQCGLIETTPKNATHDIRITGSDWQNAEVQLDGHTLRGVYSLEMSMAAGEPQEVKLAFSRSRVHLDQKYLPEHIKVHIEGMDKTLEVLRTLTKLREDGFKDKETGEIFARLHSSDEEVEIYRDAYETLKMYEAVDDSFVEANSSASVH